MDVYYVYLLGGAAVLAFKCGSLVFYGTEENQFLVCRFRRIGVLQDHVDPLVTSYPVQQLAPGQGFGAPTRTPIATSSSIA